MACVVLFDRVKVEDEAVSGECTHGTNERGHY